MIRGKGSVKEGKVGRKDGQMLPGEDEPLHALVTANTMENVKKAVEQVRSPQLFGCIILFLDVPSEVLLLYVFNVPPGFYAMYINGEKCVFRFATF